MSRAKKIVLGVAGVALLAAVAHVASGLPQGIKQTDRVIPTARVQRGDLDMKVYATGELRPSRSAQLIVPSVPGTLQIVMILPTGSYAKEGDVVVEFDTSEQEYNLEQAQLELMQSEQEITRARADAAVQASLDQVSLLSARYSVRRAELEVSKRELLSAIDAKKNELALEEAKRRLAQLGLDTKNRAASSQAGIAVQEARRNRSRLQMMQAKQGIESLTMKAPMSGLVSVKENTEGQNIFIGGMAVPEYREGDLTSPGRTIVEILEVTTMELLSRIPESETGNIRLGQTVEVSVDAQPGRTYKGLIKTIAGTASTGVGRFSSAGPVRRFDVVIELSNPDSALRPGVTAQVTIQGESVKNALLLPRQALFEKDGKQVIYVKAGGTFTAREVKVSYRTESRVAIEALSENTEVALVNPEGQARTPGKGEAESAGPLIPKATSKGPGT
jgi:multidrug efflux pump subunit AcrA (membrane-fusion protein)